MKIFEIKLRTASVYDDGCYHSMVVIAETPEKAIEVASKIDEHGNSYSENSNWRISNFGKYYDIFEIGNSNDTVPRFVTGYYVPYNYYFDE